MKKYQRSLKHSIYLLLTFFLQSTTGIAQEFNLGFSGTSVTQFAQCGTRIYAALDEQKGLFYTDDFAERWSYAGVKDTPYHYGPVDSVVCDEERVYIITGRQILQSKFVNGVAHNWERVNLSSDYFGSPTALAIAGDYIFIGTNYTYIVTLRRTADPEFVGGFQITGNGSISRIAAYQDSRKHYWIYALRGLVGQVGDTITAVTYVRATDRPKFEDITPPEVAPYERSFGGVFVDTDGVLYVPTLGAAQERSKIFVRRPSSNPLWESASLTYAQTENQILNWGGASFSGDIKLVGRFFSSDGGFHFTELNIPPDEETEAGKFTGHPHAVLIDMHNPSQAMVSTPNGPFVTQNLELGKSSSWQEKSIGLLGAPILAIDQLKSAPNKIVIATNRGVYRSTDFDKAFDDDPETLPEYEVVAVAGSTIGLDDQSLGGIFTVALDRYISEKDVVYIGREFTFERVQFINNQGIRDKNYYRGTPSAHPRNILITDKVVVGYVKSDSESNFGGSVKVFGKESIRSPEAIGLEGMPVSSLAGNEKVLFAGAGGYFSSVPQAAQAEYRGLWRSLDKGVTWQKIEHPKIYGMGIPCLAYDEEQDLLYICANTIGIKDYALSIKNPNFIPDQPGDGTVLRLMNASSENFSIIDSTVGLPENLPISALSIDAMEEPKRIFASAGADTYMSDSDGATWASYHKGAPNQEAISLFFDDLLVGTDFGLKGIDNSHQPVFITSDLTASVRRGTRDALAVRFNRDYDPSDANLAKLQAKISTAKRDARIEAIKRDSRIIEFRPGKRGWSGKKLTFTIDRDFKAKEDGDDVPDFLDSDFDTNPDGGSFSVPITLEPPLSKKKSTKRR